MKLIYFICLAGIWLLSGCEKETETYQWADCVNFEVKQQGVLCDTSEYTFAFEEAEVTGMMAKVRIQMTGHLAEQDRKINIRVVSADTDPEGNASYSFDADTCYIRKGQTFLDLNVQLKRNPDMQGRIYAVRLEINENEWFKTTNREWITDATNNKKIDLLRHTIIFSDIITKPITWDDYYFGTWSIKKFLLMCEETGFKRKDFQNQSYMATGRKNYTKDFMNNYFREYKEANKNNPEALKRIQEEDGTLMKMGS